MTANRLRFVLVEMLFALAIGELALEVGDFIFNNPLSHFFRNYHVITQLLLATYILTSSWIGWQNSTAPGNLRETKSVFSLQYVILLVDVILVILYFTLTRGVENKSTRYLLTIPASLTPKSSKLTPL